MFLFDGPVDALSSLQGVVLVHSSAGGVNLCGHVWYEPPVGPCVEGWSSVVDQSWGGLHTNSGGREGEPLLA